MARATTKKATGDAGEDKPEAPAKTAAAAKPKAAASGAAKATAKPPAKDAAAGKAAAKPKKAVRAGDAENKGVDGAHKGVTASPELAKIIGEDSMKRTEVVSRVWEYVRKHNLQNPEDKREIIANDDLKKVFGRDRATMFEMNKLVFAHLK